jgi:hypothetical protein
VEVVNDRSKRAGEQERQFPAAFSGH